METDNLKEFELKYSCFTKATNGFWEYVNSWKVDEPDEFYEAFMTFDISKIVLEKGQPIEYVQTTLVVLFMEGFFAEYRILQKLNGEIMDDGLSFK
ncbi:hypothetical protein NSS79_09980 [Paenibacillus sp. FSL L8-0436]|uniref:hypothetical protein n=1 Tax=Paenibacillus sp. FSL L8-0436 TaxID=2954686 RepID=UPI003158CDD4